MTHQFHKLIFSWLIFLPALTLPSVAIGALGEIDRSISICYNYAIEPVPSPSSQVPKCRVTGDTMYIDGSIFPDELLFEIKDLYPEVKKLQLNSHGGPIRNIEKLVEHIRYRGISTHVRKGAVCSSACTMVFMAGVRRTAAPGARFMFHGVNNGGREINIKDFCQQQGYDQCGKKLVELVDDQRDSTRKFFEAYIALGASQNLWLNYQSFPEDPKWWEHGNFFKRQDWVMTAEEAMSYNIVQALEP